MKVLITGICGFVGSSISRYLKSAHKDWQIIGLDNFIRPGSERNRLELKRQGIRIFHADIRAASDFETLPKVDAVIDAAANPSVLAGVDGQTSSRQLVEHNLLGTVNMLEFCKSHKAAFILLSTSRVYSIPPLAALAVSVKDDAFTPDFSATLPSGLSPAGLDETFTTRAPVSLYGSTKLTSEALALEYGATFGFPVWVNRCGVLAGAGQFGRPDQGIFAYWLNCWHTKKPLKYIGFGGSGFQVRDCLHPDDLARLIIQQLNNTKKDLDPLINVSGGAGNAMSLKQLSQWCETRWGFHGVTSDSTPRPFDIPWMILDARRACEQWNWQPERNLTSILTEIGDHAEANPDWLDLSAP